MDFVLTALAVFWVWELFLVVTPLRPPPALQPLLVAGCALGAPYVPDVYLTAAAVAGAVALLHRVVSLETATTVMKRPRLRRLPPI